MGFISSRWKDINSGYVITQRFLTKYPRIFCRLKLSKRIEKRVFKIPPLKITTELIGHIGQIVEAQNVFENIKYELNSPTADIESSKISNFVVAKWPNEINTINMQYGAWHGSPSISIIFNLNTSMKESKVEIYGDDPVWVNGILHSLEDAISEKRLDHYWFINSGFLKLLSSIGLIASFGYFLQMILFPYIGTNYQEFILAGLLFSIIFMVDWVNKLYPYLEYGNQYPVKIRKFIIAIISASGIIPLIIQYIIDKR